MEEIIDNIDEQEIPFRYAITSYGADYTIDGIIERLQKGKIFIPPFQRSYVWPMQRASRFIESLILGLPVPGIFLYEKDKKLQVVDGQQRIITLQNFYNNDFNDRPFRLKSVQPELEGKTYDELSESDRDRLDNCMLHATIFKQDEPSSDDSSIYMIFERLNTGGLPLQAQEVRACVYYGEFNRVLKELTENGHWRSIFGSKNPRMKEEELILRYFALYYNLAQYKEGLKGFLNSFMAENKNLEVHNEKELRSLFESTIEILYSAIGASFGKIGNQVNAAILDAFMVGISQLNNEGKTTSPDVVKEVYDSLIKNQDFIQYVSSTTSSVSSVNGRINLVKSSIAERINQ